MKLYTTRFMTLMTATSLLAACGTKTDPTTDYNDLPKGVPATKVVPESKSYVLPGGIFRGEMASEMQFIEGEEKAYDISISTVLKVTFGLTVEGLPPGVQPVQLDALHYQIKGTVPVGTSMGIATGQVFPLHVAAVNPQGKQDQVGLFAHATHEWSPSVRVFPTNKIPTVESQDINGLQVNEGSTLPIAIVVNDPGSHDAQTPSIESPFKDNAQSGEVAFVSAMPGLSMSATPEKLGGGRFKFSGTLDTKQLQLPAGKKNVTARLVVKFRSPSGQVSADEIIDVKIIRAEPAPAAAPAPAASAPVAPAPAPAAPVTSTPAAAAPAPTATKPAPEVTTAKTVAPKKVTPKKSTTKRTTKPAAKSTGKSTAKPKPKTATAPAQPATKTETKKETKP